MRLSPVPAANFNCPLCGKPMATQGYWLPGMHVCAKTACALCVRQFYSILPIHFGNHSEVHFDRETMTVVKAEGHWYAKSLPREARVIERDPVLRIERRRPILKPVYLTVVDYLYGHCFHRIYKSLQLLDAQPPADILMVVPTYMEWLVPDNVAELWVVDIPPAEGRALFPALAIRLAERLDQLPPCDVADMWAPGPVDISRFTRVEPLNQRTPGAFGRPVLTFSWRDDRHWTYRGGELAGAEAALQQAQLFVRLCEVLRDRLPDLDVAVTGYGEIGKFPSWIEDMRITRRTDACERGWVERYARSHATMGVYGSNMLLPMAHSGGAIQLVTPKYMHVINHATEFIDHRFSASLALGQIFTIPTSASLSDVATYTMATLQRAARTLANRHGVKNPARWVFEDFPFFKLRDANGALL